VVGDSELALLAPLVDGLEDRNKLRARAHNAWR
jgi:hypothetical protein